MRLDSCLFHLVGMITKCHLQRLNRNWLPVSLSQLHAVVRDFIPWILGRPAKTAYIKQNELQSTKDVSTWIKKYRVLG